MVCLEPGEGVPGWAVMKMNDPFFTNVKCEGKSESKYERNLMRAREPWKIIRMSSILCKEQTALWLHKRRVTINLVGQVNLPRCSWG
jgi:hypothetical protein